MAQVIPPDTRAAGQSGHIGDHNNIADMLTLFQNELAAIPTIIQFGSATLVAGTVTVPNGSVFTGCIVILSRQTIGGTAGNLTWTITPSTSFTISSSSGTDTSVVAWLLIG